MKTILRILIIVLVGILVSGALYLIVENTSLFSNIGGFPENPSELGEPPEMPAGELGERPEGDNDNHHAASLSRGLSEIGVSLAKIATITIVVLLIQGTFTLLRQRLLAKSPASA